jgi:hypothetical protein
VTGWLIGQAGLNALRDEDPHLAGKVFNRAGSFVIGMPPAGWDTVPVASYHSYAAYAEARVSQYRWVMYDPEAWSDTPLVEQQHPVAFIAAFATLAHARGQKVIAAPARDLVTVPGADYSTRTFGQTVDGAFLAAGLPAACAVADIYHCQAQANQRSAVVYTALLDSAIGQLPAAFPVWAGLTVLRADPVASVVACYQAARAKVDGFWLNTGQDTAGPAAEFLRAISRG